MDFIHKVKAFQELNVTELYELLKLRSLVFVVEQQCVFLDADDKDSRCLHLLLFSGNQLAGYSRLIPAGVSYPEMSIGRVVTLPDFRSKGLGRKVMELSIQACYDLIGNKPIRIGAQYYALKFYESLGFVRDGDIYDEDGIDHVEMILAPNQ